MTLIDYTKKVTYQSSTEDIFPPLTPPSNQFGKLKECESRLAQLMQVASHAFSTAVLLQGVSKLQILN